MRWIAENRGDAQAAIDYYSAVSRGPNYLEAGLRMAALLAGEGELEAARQKLQALRAEVPAHGQRIYLVEGEILRDAGRKGEALTLYSQALEAYPADIGLRYARAMMAERLDRLDLMERDLLRILEQDSDNVDTLNALGYTLADRTDRYEEAYGYIKRALALRPDNNAILDSMGWVLYRMGNYEEAIQYLRRSLKLKMDDEVAAHLGEVLWVSGRHKEALEIWNQALEQFSGNKILLDVIKRFSH
ncbi:MAG: tetratricopeptide repeat protein [Gammaproteobacteria bacterium]